MPLAACRYATRNHRGRHEEHEGQRLSSILRVLHVFATVLSRAGLERPNQHQIQRLLTSLEARGR